MLYRMFDYEIKFPLESQLKIGISDETHFGKTEIGHTEIDLESRYYSKCYATCGLAESFDIVQNNDWRDAKRPSQILNKICRDYKITPVYSDTSALTLKVPTLKIKQDGNINGVFENITTFGDDKDVQSKYIEKLKSSYKKNTALNSAHTNKYLREYYAFDALKDWESITNVRAFLNSQQI